jgi:hypothetical protein
MPHETIQWLRRIKQVEAEYAAAILATNHFLTTA